MLKRRLSSNYLPQTRGARVSPASHILSLLPARDFAAKTKQPTLCFRSKCFHRPESSDPNPINQCLPFSYSHSTLWSNSSEKQFSKLFGSIQFQTKPKYGIDTCKSFGIHAQILAQIIHQRPVQITGSHRSAF